MTPGRMTVRTALTMLVTVRILARPTVASVQLTMNWWIRIPYFRKTLNPIQLTCHWYGQHEFRGYSNLWGELRIRPHRGLVVT